MWAGEHEVPHEQSADGEKRGDEDEVKMGGFFVPGQTTVKQYILGLDCLRRINIRTSLPSLTDHPSTH